MFMVEIVGLLFVHLLFESKFFLQKLILPSQFDILIPIMLIISIPIPILPDSVLHKNTKHLQSLIKFLSLAILPLVMQLPIHLPIQLPGINSQPLDIFPHSSVPKHLNPNS